MDRSDSPDRPRALTVLVALAANTGVAVAKIFAGVLTGSSAMMAEAWHAVADSGNEAVLWVAQRRAQGGPDERHPLGRGREAYFWSLLAAVGVFVAGGVLSVLQGWHELTEPSPASDFAVAYVVLVVALVLESLSFTQAARELRREAAQFRRGFLQHVRLSSEPTSRAVFAEDGAAIVGNLVALAGVGLHQVTGSPVPDGVASLLIGVLLGVVGVTLAARNRDFLVGEAVPATVRDRCRALIVAEAGVDAVTDLLVIFSGPRQMILIAHVDLDDRLRADEVEALVRHLDDRLRSEVPMLARVEIVPAGPAGAPVAAPDGGAAGAASG